MSAALAAKLAAAGVASRAVLMPAETRKAAQASGAAGGALDQIMKSIIFDGSASASLRNRLCPRGFTFSIPFRQKAHSMLGVPCHHC
ncbi:MAG: hypothetical protein U5N55_09535 [Cypionkella sp.]|nr:hypothetical protein [Cypionkella sp.]